MTVNHALPPAGTALSGISLPAGSSPQGPQACEFSCSPPSGRTTVTRRSITPVADGFVTCTPGCNAGPTCAEHWWPACVRINGRPPVAWPGSWRRGHAAAAHCSPRADRRPRPPRPDRRAIPRQPAGRRSAAAAAGPAGAGCPAPRRHRQPEIRCFPAKNRARAARCHPGRSPGQDRTSRRRTLLLPRSAGVRGTTLRCSARAFGMALGGTSLGSSWACHRTWRKPQAHRQNHLPGPRRPAPDPRARRHPRHHPQTHRRPGPSTGPPRC